MQSRHRRVSSNPPKANGSSCDDGDACTLMDECQGGLCVWSSRTECAPPDSCHEAGVCKSSTGVCQYAAKPDGTFCGDAGSECVRQDTCASGACQDNGFEAPGTACGNPASGACDAPDACDGAGVCQPNLVPNGTACDDSDATTCTDVCNAGVCAGTPTAVPPEVDDSLRLAKAGALPR